MTNRNIAVLACKILALYCVLRIIDYLQIAFLQISNLSVLQEPLAVYVFIAAITPLCFLVALSISIWYFADLLASKMVDDENICDERKLNAPSDLTAIAISIVGLYFVVQALNGIASTMFNYWLLDKGARAISGWSNASNVKLYTDITQLTIGILLMLGSRRLLSIIDLFRKAGISGVLARIRNAGTITIDKDE